MGGGCEVWIIFLFQFFQFIDVYGIKGFVQGVFFNILAFYSNDVLVFGNDVDFVIFVLMVIFFESFVFIDYGGLFIIVVCFFVNFY